MPGLIAIVGRPNVGKSALFNRIARKRIAIVHDLPGVTRDRVSAEAEWQGRSFTLVDTGGIGLWQGQKAEEAIAKAAVDQAGIALETADVILLVVNLKDGLMPLDEEVALRLRAAGKPVLVAANKADTGANDHETAAFSSLGFQRIFPVSAIHGRGVDALVEAAVTLLPADLGEPGLIQSLSQAPAESDAPGEADAADTPARSAQVRPLKLAIVGRPNVGKSSLINALTKSERVIVSPVPGTTRDAVDVPFEVDTQGRRERYVLIDTAGMRKARRVHDSIEFFSVKRTEESIARCDIAVLVMDAEQGITEQDKKIADHIVQNRRACVVVVNKWDLVSDVVRKARVAQVKQRAQKSGRRHASQPATTLQEFGQWVQERLFFLDYAPVLFTSALSGFHLERLLESVRYVGAQLRRTIPTALLNRTLMDAVEKRQPVSKQGHRLKFYYATQTRTDPPTFLLFVNRVDLFADAYRKYLATALRAAFGFEGCPLILVPKARPKSIEPIRKFRAANRQKADPRPPRKGALRGRARGARTRSSGRARPSRGRRT